MIRLCVLEHQDLVRAFRLEVTLATIHLTSLASLDLPSLIA